jgi:hypothetical protein
MRMFVLCWKEIPVGCDVVENTPSHGLGYFLSTPSDEVAASVNHGE